MTKKEARAECRRLCAETRRGMWEMLWDKQNGYYPAPDCKGLINNKHCCWVDKSGKYVYRTKCSKCGCPIYDSVCGYCDVTFVG